MEVIYHPKADDEVLETGVACLTPAQRAALDRWLKRYTSVVLGVAASSPGHTAVVPSRPARPSVSVARIYASVGGGHWISENSSSGRIIQLEDGSLWEINGG